MQLEAPFVLADATRGLYRPTAQMTIGFMYLKLIPYSIRGWLVPETMRRAYSGYTMSNDYCMFFGGMQRGLFGNCRRQVYRSAKYAAHSMQYPVSSM